MSKPRAPQARRGSAPSIAWGPVSLSVHAGSHQRKLPRVQTWGDEFSGAEIRGILRQGRTGGHKAVGFVDMPLPLSVATHTLEFKLHFGANLIEASALARSNSNKDEGNAPATLPDVIASLSALVSAPSSVLSPRIADDNAGDEEPPSGVWCTVTASGGDKARSGVAFPVANAEVWTWNERFVLSLYSPVEMIRVNLYNSDNHRPTNKLFSFTFSAATALTPTLQMKRQDLDSATGAYLRFSASCRRAQPAPGSDQGAEGGRKGMQGESDSGDEGIADSGRSKGVRDNEERRKGRRQPKVGLDEPAKEKGKRGQKKHRSLSPGDASKQRHESNVGGDVEGKAEEGGEGEGEGGEEEGQRKRRSRRRRRKSGSPSPHALDNNLDNVGVERKEGEGRAGFVKPPLPRPSSWQALPKAKPQQQQQGVPPNVRGRGIHARPAPVAQATPVQRMGVLGAVRGLFASRRASSAEAVPRVFLSDGIRSWDPNGDHNDQDEDRRLWNRFAQLRPASVHEGVQEQPSPHNNPRPLHKPFGSMPDVLFP